MNEFEFEELAKIYDKIAEDELIDEFGDLAISDIADEYMSSLCDDDEDNEDTWTETFINNSMGTCSERWIEFNYFSSYGISKDN